MVVKMRSLVIVSLLLMLFLGVVYGQNPKTFGSIITSTLSIDTPTENAMSTDSGADFNTFKSYVPTTVNKAKPNLFVGGILQKSPNADLTDQKWRDFASNNNAIFVPAYYSGSIVSDTSAVNDAAKSGTIDENGLTRKGATGENGLIRDELNEYSPGKSRQYGTIIGYSGGTTTVVKAMATQGVKADTLILISPMQGWILNDNFDWNAEFENNIETILSLNHGIKIIVLQSENDILPFELGQYKFMKGRFPNNVEMHNVKLENCGAIPPCHNYFFDTYAMENIKNGVYMDPQSQGVAPTVQSFKVAPLSLNSGESFKIDYTVSDNGLKQVELWRTQEKDKWPESPENPIQTNTLAGENGPISGSFTDTPSAPGKYWYGLHVVDNAGNWNDKRTLIPIIRWIVMSLLR